MLSHVQQLQLQQEASCKEKAWRMRGERLQGSISILPL